MKTKHALVLFFALIASTAQASSANWTPGLPTYDHGGIDGKRWLRTLIHIHSVYSFDACDFLPQPFGIINERCLESFRKGLCENRIDVAFVTEHQKLMGKADFNALLSLRDGDVPLMEGDQIIGSLQQCTNGHVVRLYPGSENNLMAIGLKRHPPKYQGFSAELAEQFREAGALVGVPHPEVRSFDKIQRVGPDFVEVYNLHANLNSILEDRSRAIQVIGDIFKFLFRGSLVSDLFHLSFLEENEDELKKWSQLVLTKRVTGTAGSDIHQNAFPFRMPDGDRGDSYRRGMRWVANFVQVEGEPTRESILGAIKEGNLFVGFEGVGTPDQFSFTAVSDTVTYPMGSRVARDRTGSVRLAASLPILREWNPASPYPELSIRLLKATEEGWQEVARESGKPLDYLVTDPGVYRAEVRIVPHHLREFLPKMRRLIRELPWVYSNPIYVD